MSRCIYIPDGERTGVVHRHRARKRARRVCQSTEGENRDELHDHWRLSLKEVGDGERIDFGGVLLYTPTQGLRFLSCMIC